MSQPLWTVTRCWISQPGARRRWDKAYQLLLGVAGPSTTEGRDGVDPRHQSEESRHAGDCVPPGVFWTQDTAMRPPLLGRVRRTIRAWSEQGCGRHSSPAAVLIIARDEGPDRGANLLGIAEDPAPHDLLLEGVLSGLAPLPLADG